VSSDAVLLSPLHGNRRLKTVLAQRRMLNSACTLPVGGREKQTLGGYEPKLDEPSLDRSTKSTNFSMNSNRLVAWKLKENIEGIKQTKKHQGKFLQ
jgi:hypothetical protein